MAPGRLSKRPRADTADYESATSGARSTQKGKRARRSYSYDSDNNSPSERESASSQSDERLDDAAADYEDGDDADFQAQTQRIHDKLKNFTENIPSESGIVEEIRCTNFMCHEQLTVTLGPLINFIIGHNGSGKSAVLTALTLCLAGTTAATNRGSKLSSFIKEGKDFCTISVKLKNEGIAAYRPEMYGDSIIVERHITKTSSAFKLKDMNGKTTSTKKKDVEDVVDAFALQIDNPISVLTQDMARQFLNSSDPKEKYKFFLKGTQLSTLKSDYDLIQQELDTMEAKSHTVLEDVQVLRREFDKAKEKAFNAKNLEKMKHLETMLAHQSAWAQVEQVERELAEAEEQITKIDRRIQERLAEAENHAKEYAKADTIVSETNQKIAKLEEEKIPAQDQLEKVQAELKTNKDARIEAMRTARELKDKFDSKEREVEKYESEIEKLRQRQAEADNGQHAQKIAELENAQTHLAQEKQRLASHNEDLQNLANDKTSAEKNLAPAERVVEDKGQEVRRVQTRINEIQHGGQRDWMSTYDRNLKQLLQAIDANREFREKPVGPLGRHVKILEPKWSSILEKAMGKALNAFVVTSKSDQTVLSRLMKSSGYSGTVLIGKGGHIDTSGHRPDASLTTWLDILRIDNELVRNQLIVQQAVDQVVLIERRAEAEDFMHNGGDRRNRVKACLCMAESDPSKGHNITFNPQSGSVNISPIDAWRGQFRMQADKEPQLRAYREDLRRLQDEFQSVKVDAGKAKAQANACADRLQKHAQRKRILTRQVQEAQEQVDQLEEDVNAATPDSGKITQLQIELEKARKDMDFEKGQREDCDDRHNNLHEESKDLEKKVKQAQLCVSELNAKIGKVEHNRQNRQEEREQALRNKNASLDRVAKTKEAKTEWEKEKGSRMAVVEENVAQAEQICARIPVPVGATFEKLDRERMNCKRQREEQERELGGSQELLTDLANAAKAKWKNAYNEYEQLTSLKQELTRSLHSRQLRWNEFRKRISVQARTTFQYLLSERNFRGELKLDHKNQRLDLNIQPDINEASNAGRQTKTLSGGEKSYSTICLLLSLWDAMGSPIRCLDEFDVFMDQVNRNVSMRMIIKVARRAVGRQFILITPQAMNQVDGQADVKIHRLSDPERGQTALNFAG